MQHVTVSKDTFELLSLIYTQLLISLAHYNANQLADCIFEGRETFFALKCSTELINIVCLLFHEFSLLLHF